MTWLSTWIHDGCPQFAQHASEQGAEEHAKVKGGVAFWSSDEGPRGAAVGVAGVEVAPEDYNHVIRPKWNDPTEGAA